ncbi:histone-lysine N-methyltransferase [Plasmodium brasilianum]|uniref:Histone-lysine N-methyltransferase, H3 lysine-4 specific, putative n=2 Tax=Plasmodium (Plasmodium) TaxID=418103 RepID=A0A1A8WD94_PLAMA|nr:histone-lysine N-methyltransferase, H3 lysine-4 specific, putative [Plasmodium malariae]KAI4834925.1 histone-lysine N-methyltransferase [Plasmodium brasilianum]SBS90842.1 hypothetical protein PMALA_031050 [Plasmodium malariae]SCP03494.1 histone-lysine N-methyltransferase, H3 lysine-4 specific, putative [Plasmodium malariae]
MSFSPIKYESKILSNLASMLKLREKSDKEILSEIKEEKVNIRFEIDEDIKKVIDINKINCTCNESKKKMEEYNGKKFEYYYNVETYGVDFFLDICNALGRSNYKPFLTEEGKNEIINGLRVRRSSNLYKFVSFFLSKERLNKDRLNDGKTPENIFHCFKCLKSVLHIYADSQNSSKAKMFLGDTYINNNSNRNNSSSNNNSNNNNCNSGNSNNNNNSNSSNNSNNNNDSSDIYSNKYITEEMEDHIENDNLSEKDNFEKRKKNHRDGIIVVSKYKSELTSISRKSNEKIMKTIFEHTKDMNNDKRSNVFQKIYPFKKSNTFEKVNKYSKSRIYDNDKLKYNSQSFQTLKNENKDISTYKNINKKKYFSTQNKSLTRNSYGKNYNSDSYNKNKETKKRSSQKSKNSRNSFHSLSNKNVSATKKKEANDTIYCTDTDVAANVDLNREGNSNEKHGKEVEKGHMKRTTWSCMPKGEETDGTSHENCANAICSELKNVTISEERERNEAMEYIGPGNKLEKVENMNHSDNIKHMNGSEILKRASASEEMSKDDGITGELDDKDCVLDEVITGLNKYEINEKKESVKKSSNEEESYYNPSDNESYSTDDSNYKKYLRKKKKLQDQGKIVIDLNIMRGNSIKSVNKRDKDERHEEKMQETLRMKQVNKILEQKKMIFCKIEDIAKKRNKRYVKTQVLSEDSKIERVYFSHKIKKFYNSKSGYFGCGWSNNRTEWTPFIHAPFFDNQHNAIYKNRNKKLYEEIYDTLLHGRIHPYIKIVELKDHKHPVRLCTPYTEDCYSILYTGKKISSTDDRVIFGEYTGFVANNRELSQEKHQYMFALTFNKKVFNDKKNVVFINEIESDEEEGCSENVPCTVSDSSDHNSNINSSNSTVDNSNNNFNHNSSGNNDNNSNRHSGNYLRNNFERIEGCGNDRQSVVNEDKECDEEITNNIRKNEKEKIYSNLMNIQNNNLTDKANKGKKSKTSCFNKKAKGLNNLVILPDNYTYAVDSSYMFNEMSLVNHYKTCSIFNNYDFRINAEWQLVYLDGWPHIILTSIPGVEINTGEEIFADFGFEWFEKVNDICLNSFIKNCYEHRLIKLNLCKEKYFNGIDDIVEKYNLLKTHTTCNLCMHNVNTDCGNFIYCSGCNHVYHLKCVHKLYTEVNENYDWFCSSCVQLCMNIINQKEFLQHIEKENHKKLIDFFNDISSVDNSKKNANDLLASQNNSQPSTLIEHENGNNNSNERNDNNEKIDNNGNNRSNDENCSTGFEKIRRLLQCKENIDHLIKNRELLNEFLQKKENEVNLLDTKEYGDFNFKDEQINYLLKDSYELHLLVEYKKKIEDLLVSRERVDTFLNNEGVKRTMKIRKKTINYLLKSKKFIENIVTKLGEEEFFRPPAASISALAADTASTFAASIGSSTVQQKTQGDSFVKIEEKQQELVDDKKYSDKLSNDSSYNIQIDKNKVNMMGETNDVCVNLGKRISDEINYNSMSSTYEQVLYSKSNMIVKNLKDIKKNEKNNRGNNGNISNLCCNYMMKLSKKFFGFSLIKDFEKGLSTNQPSLPLNDHLKKLSVCSNCYKKHHDLSKAIICRVTKMHFEANYNDGLSEEDLFKTSSECIQLVIRELANTIKEYRKKELNGAYIQHMITSGGDTFKDKGNNENNIAIKFNNSVTPNKVSSSSAFSNKNHMEEEKPFYEVIITALSDDKNEKDNNIITGNTPPLNDDRMNYTGYYTDKKEESSLLFHKRIRDNYDYSKERCNNLSQFRINQHRNSMINRKSTNKDQECSVNETHDVYRDENTTMPNRHTDSNSADNKNTNSEYYENENGKNKENENDKNNEGDNDNEKDNDNNNNDNNDYNEKNNNNEENENENENLGTTNEIWNSEKKNFDYFHNRYKISNFIPLFGVELGKTKFQREFTNGTFVGTVTEQIKDEHDNNFFVVTYEDGDVEWITPSFLFQELLKQSTNNLEYPLASNFKELFNPYFKKDIKLNNCSLELKIEKRKRKSNCEYNSNNNSVNKRQKHAQEESSLKKKKQKF